MACCDSDDAGGPLGQPTNGMLIRQSRVTTMAGARWQQPLDAAGGVINAMLIVSYKELGHRQRTLKAPNCHSDTIWYQRSR